MSKEEDAFLRAIGQNPDDQLTRLVYADLLDERGDPRGEYIRRCCRLSEVRNGIDPEWRRAVRETHLRVDDLRLATGRTISLDSLRQFKVYGGLLEGMPTREMNQRIIDRLIAEEQARPFASTPPLLLTPEQRPIEYQDDRPYPFGEPAQLPAIACVGRFSSSPARDMARDGSVLVVIWFQDNFAPPIGPDVWPQFREMDWNQYAVDGDW